LGQQQRQENLENMMQDLQHPLRSLEAFLLENVPGLQRVHWRDLEATMDIFRSAGYVPLSNGVLLKFC